MKSLGVALYRADMINTTKLLTAWPEYVQQYILQFILKNGEDPKPDDKRMRDEVNAIMDNHQDHVCIILKKDQTVGELIKHLSHK